MTDAWFAALAIDVGCRVEALHHDASNAVRGDEVLPLIRADLVLEKGATVCG